MVSYWASGLLDPLIEVVSSKSMDLAISLHSIKASTDVTVHCKTSLREEDGMEDGGKWLSC